MCDLDGALVGASASARAILGAVGGATRLPRSLWATLDATPAGEAIVWIPPDRDHPVIGCTRYPVGDAQALLVMREITEKHERLVQQLGRHRAKTLELLVYALAHDLRAPLASIVFNLDVLADRWTELEPAALSESLDESLVAAMQLRETIDALVDLVRVGPPRLADLQVGAVVDRAVALTRPLFRQHGHDVTVRLDPAAPSIRANALAVQQILMSLLLNAAEATAHPMTVEITSEPATLRGGPRGGTAVRICVRDHGPGVPPELVGHLFQPFFTTKAAATGHGLTLARDAVAAEHGTLRLVPVDRGACFELVLPAGAEAAGSAGGSPARAPRRRA